MRLKWFFAVLVLLVSVLLAGPALTQDAPSGDTDPDQPVAEAPAADDEKEGWPFALYAHVATGTGGAEAVENSVATGVTTVARGELELDQVIHSKSVLGWKLPKGKGDFRLGWTSLKEDGYKFTSRGFQNAIDPALSIGSPVSDNLLWWTAQAEDGVLNVTRTPPKWSLADDANGDGTVNFNEADSSLADLTINRPFVSDLQNRVQFIDALYGREFGRRRFSSRWWSGLRYSKYEGNILAGAWLSSAPEVGIGFTDGSAVNFLNFYQESSGFGPTGALELDVNFFDKRLTLYMQAQAAFMVMDIETDSGPFITQVTASAGTGDITNVPNRLSETRNKSTWQDSFEAGVRVRLKTGLEIELAYSKIGILDAIIMPSAIQIPGNLQEAPFGTSAIYSTKDLVLDTVRAGVGFQF